MTAPLLLALLVIQGPSGALPAEGLYGEPRLASGIVVEEMAEAQARPAGPDAFGCLYGSILCRHSAVVVGDGIANRRQLAIIQSSFTGKTLKRRGYFVGYQVTPPDCDTYSDCQMWYRQQQQNEEISLRMQMVARSNRELAAASSKQQRTCDAGTCPPLTDTSPAGEATLRSSRPAYGGGRSASSAVSAAGSGGTAYTSTRSSGGGGSDRTGTAKER